MTATGLEPRATSLVNEHSTIWPNWPNDWSMFWMIICTVHLTVCSCHVMYAFQSESTLSSCLNAKKLLARSRRAIWNLSDCNWTRIQNHLVRKRTLNHLPKLAWVSRNAYQTIMIFYKFIYFKILEKAIYKIFPHLKNSLYITSWCQIKLAWS